ncbi:TPA: L-serine ammonia-lyase [Klebsiella pneumoniae]|uniref:L-serine ammonia-lyase n=1 Tax=Klebsiella pneumoniae complex TaxID=3390273 RepID=UPI000649938A|nr:L-serine ammonia-lyase [Klebsiella pneumoniae]MDU7325034.1 L-serine ammonia-lyase [Klebsiella michiganensis]AKL27230.1 serine dehydratase [Klebsiella pneumoniae]ALR28632.1 serine dehydratase [Klebsiella pneumoniae]KMI23429.1 L-serine ammonia-lyase [Klebsiella pneumoniae]SAT36174.1 L-serine dehydratase [Klebsiella pneumoniae]
MALSVFDLFKIGIGPSSSHTVGPMRAACQFIQYLMENKLIEETRRVQIKLYGSLSATGVGHGTDNAILLGLMGFEPETIDTDRVNSLVETIKRDRVLRLNNHHPIVFDYHHDVIFLQESLPYHPNAMTFTVWGQQAEIYSNTLYSIGGGFIVSQQQTQEGGLVNDKTRLPYPFSSADELLHLCKTHRLSVSNLMMENEKCWRSEEEVRTKILSIWCVMQKCIENGIKHEGVLPGGLRVKRRAHQFHQRLLDANKPNIITSTLSAMEWINLFALAVNEENAAGGRVVTAPTNGAAGIIPAVLHYYMKFSPKACEEDVVKFFLSATSVGILCKLNASISGAEVGCQGEVGSACAMAAAGLAEVLGATPEQLENAAEIGLEHNLGLTCDPVGGLVQVPCIERNAIAAVKAVNAVQIALRGDGHHFVSLDKVIRTMKETGKDMSEKYKETSQGGLAVNTIEC